MKALFISVSELKKKSIIDGNVDADKIIYEIEVAQDIHIHQYLGSRLYEKMQNLIVNNTIDDAINANYKNLLESYIKPCLIWFSQAEYITFSNYTIDNGGLNKHRGEDEDFLNIDEIDKLSAKCSARADFYTQRLNDYLCNNSNLFPEFLNNSNEDLRPNRDNNNFSSIVI